MNTRAASDAQLATATAENVFEFLLGLGGKVETTPELTRYADESIASPMFNGVVRTRLEPARVDAAIDETVAWFRERGRPAVFWWQGPDCAPRDLGVALMAKGFAPFDVDSPAMGMSLDDVEGEAAPPGLTIRRVSDMDGAREWARTFVAAFGVPEFAGQAWVDASERFGARTPFHLYTGRIDGEPVATSMLAPAFGVAGLLAIGTVEPARGRGIGRAMTLVPMVDAKTMGFETSVLFASALGKPVYERLGFRTVGAISRYVLRF